MAAIPDMGTICDEIAVATVTAVCTHDPGHRVTAKVCDLHEQHLADAMFCRPCYDQLRDGVRMTTTVTAIPTQRLEVVRNLPDQRKVILP